MITKEDTRALRQADTLVFHHLPVDRRNGSVGSIRALKKVMREEIDDLKKHLEVFGISSPNFDQLAEKAIQEAL